MHITGFDCLDGEHMLPAVTEVVEVAQVVCGIQDSPQLDLAIILNVFEHVGKLGFWWHVAIELVAELKRCSLRRVQSPLTRMRRQIGGLKCSGSSWIFRVYSSG